MTKQEYRESIDQVIELVGCALRGERPDRDRIAGMNLENLYEAAKKHQIAAAVGMALESAGVKDGRFVQAVARAQRKNALLDADRAAVLARMEEAGIWYMPLKGAILKDLYPRYGMREMADNDILFDKERGEDLRRIMVELGFTVERFDDGIPEDVYFKKPVSNFEMHRVLFSASMRGDLYPYFADVKDRLVPDEGRRYGFHFTDEDFYLYVITHEYKHYSQRGTGLRSVMDTYVYLTRKTLDMEYVRREVEKIGIGDFERQNRELALHLFGSEPLTEGDRAMLDYIVSSGTYGTIEQLAANQVATKGRWGYFLSRLTLPREVMEHAYPVLKKAPFLYPFFWVWRLLRGVFFRNRVFRTRLRAVLGIKGREED